MAASSAAQAGSQPQALTGKIRRLLTARPDSVDFRDRLYEPTLVEVPPLQRRPTSAPPPPPDRSTAACSPASESCRPQCRAGERCLKPFRQGFR